MHDLRRVLDETASPGEGADDPGISSSREKTMPDSPFQRRLNEMRQDRTARSGDRRNAAEAELLDAATFFRPVHDLVDMMYEAGVKFPASGPVRPARDYERESRGINHITITLTTRRVLKLSILRRPSSTDAVDRQPMHYCGAVHDAIHLHAKIETESLDAFGEWLAEVVALHEVGVVADLPRQRQPRRESRQSRRIDLGENDAGTDTEDE